MKVYVIHHRRGIQNVYANKESAFKELIRINNTDSIHGKEYSIYTREVMK